MAELNWKIMINKKMYISLHNLHTIFVKVLDICKKISKELVNEHGNILHLDVVSRLSDLEVVTLI